jgi:hypothetical protein
MKLDRAIIHSDLASVGSNDTEKHLGNFGAPSADEAEKTQDLACANVKTDVLDKARTRESSETENRFAYLCIFLREEGPRFGADHMANGLFRSQVSGRQCDDAFPRAQDCNLITPPEDLMDEVADEKYSHALIFELLDDLKEAIDLAARNGRRGFVHDEHPRVDRQSSSNLDGLTVGGTQSFRWNAYIDPHA